VILVPRPDGGRRALELIAIADRRQADGRPWLVHCARDVSDEARVQDYLARLASRSTPGVANSRPSQGLPLTRRQSEVLALLAQDETLQGVALGLGVSHATVRNHVQHILSRLGAHSIPEAVARFLLGRS
jgi:DNA-binding NarL/FixJ family response regulator